jgi:hypothetical protein
MDIYIFSLIIADIFQGIGTALTVRWIQQGYVQCGPYCTIQGTFQTLGETSSAMTTLVIAIHTFIVIIFRKRPKGILFPLLVVGFIWSYVISFIVIVATRIGFWNEPDPYWCWIGHQHLTAQLAGEYVWLWTAGLASIFLYVPLFVILKGWIGWKFKICKHFFSGNWIHTFLLKNLPLKKIRCEPTKQNIKILLQNFALPDQLHDPCSPSLDSTLVLQIFHHLHRGTIRFTHDIYWISDFLLCRSCQCVLVNVR